MDRGKKEKEEKRKPKYGFFSCVAYTYRYMWKNERRLALTAILSVPVSLIVTVIGLYTPSITIRALEKSGAFSTAALIIFGLLLAGLIASTLHQIIISESQFSELLMAYRMFYDRNVYERNRDFYLRFEPEVQKIDKRAQAIRNNSFEGANFPMNFANITAAVLEFFVFGTVISTLNPLIILLLAAGVVVNYFMAKWERTANYKTRDIRNSLQKKINYLVDGVSCDLRYGKEIRLYNFRDYIKILQKKLLKEDYEEQEKLARNNFLTALVSFLTVFVRDGIVYAFLIHEAVLGHVDAASFVLYFSAVNSMSEFMSDILNSIIKIQNGAVTVSDYREGFDVCGKLNKGKGIPVPDKAFTVEFKNVSYRYPESEKKVLDNVSFKIEAGEKIAVVGSNGAGKTTLTRLMCALLIPDEGEVLLNGHSVFEYNRDELYSVFGVVPQKYSIMPETVECNITCAGEGEETDKERLLYCIEAAGLKEKIASLKYGIKTFIGRQVNPDGVEFSGGEIQKLLLARAMYRKPKCLILDEPTAALDPIAEDRMYKKYRDITENTTSVFISHRLASTRFCDRIFLIEDAVIKEEGTHEELMKKSGRYKELFDIQSRYYKKEVTKDDAKIQRG